MRPTLPVEMETNASFATVCLYAQVIRTVQDGVSAEEITVSRPAIFLRIVPMIFYVTTVSVSHDQRSAEAPMTAKKGSSAIWKIVSVFLGLDARRTSSVLTASCALRKPPSVSISSSALRTLIDPTETPAWADTALRLALPPLIARAGLSA